MNINYNISASGFRNRINITTNLNGQAQNVKTYSGFRGNLAIWLGIAEKITGQDGREYTVNLRSLGKAWILSQGLENSIDRRAKKLAGIRFLTDAVMFDQPVSQLVNEINGLPKGSQLVSKIQDYKTKICSKDTSPSEKQKAYKELRMLLLNSHLKSIRIILHHLPYDEKFEFDKDSRDKVGRFLNKIQA